MAEVRARAVSLAVSGVVPLVGMAVFDWSILSLLVFMVADAAITVVADIVRYPIAKRWMAASHDADHAAGKVLLIVDGLEDGSGVRSDTGAKAPFPGTILFFGVVSTVFLVPIIGAATEHTGIAPLKEVALEKTFLWVVGIDAMWRILRAFTGAIAVRRSAPGEKMIFMESGGVAVLYLGLLTLVWLPLNWGEAGLMAMFVVVYLVRFGFGVFAYLWTPRVIRVLERRMKSGDFSVKAKG